MVCEKPLGMSSEESAELVRLAGDTGLVNAVTFNVRFYPVIQHARSLVERGGVGDIYSIHGGYWQDWLAATTPISIGALRLSRAAPCGPWATLDRTGWIWPNS